MAQDAVTLRPATPGDLELLQRWQREPQVLAAVGDDDWGWEAELRRSPAWREQLIAEVAGHPIGFVQIIDPAREDSRYWGCIAEGHRAVDLWIGEPDARNRGYGTRIMMLAIQRIFADPSVHTIVIDPLESNRRAHRFYESLGFEFVIRRRFGDDTCAVYRLRREDAAGTAN